MSTFPPTADLTTSNIGTLLADLSSSDDDKPSKNKKKNQKKRQKAKENKALQQATQQSKPQSHTSVSSATISAQLTQISQPTTTSQEQDKYAKFAHQRRLQFLSKAIQQAKEDSIAFKSNLSRQTDENKQHMIEQIQSQHRERMKKKATTRHSKIEKKLSKYISLETLRTNSAAIHLVEEGDRSSPDPFFLIFLKAYLSNIKLSPEWSQKRRIYSNKFGNEKADFFIPQYIHNLNAAHLVIKDEKTQRAQLAEMARAKAGQHNIDYQTWYDAFYTHMPKIRFDSLENTQYEGKFEAEQYQHFTPIDPISPELQRALGMYSSTSNTPLQTVAVMPPWIPAMQQYGPPPAYPNAFIPGVNAPLPPGASWSQDMYNRNNSQQYNATTSWGSMPVVQDPNDQYGMLPKWGGDVMGQTPFVQKMQIVFQQRFLELSALENDEKQNAQQQVVLSNSDPRPSLTGIWYPMSKIAPPTDDYSLLLSDHTPLPKQTLETRFQPFNHPFARKTPKLFGAIDYVGFEEKLQQQMDEQAKAEEAQRLADVAAKFSTPTISTASQQISSDAAKKTGGADAKAAFMEQQRQAQIDKALGGNIRHLATDGIADPSSFTGNMASSIYAPKAGQLFNEINLDENQDTSSGPQKRKQAPQHAHDDDKQPGGEAVKKQRQHD